MIETIFAMLIFTGLFVGVFVWLYSRQTDLGVVHTQDASNIDAYQKRERELQQDFQQGVISDQLKQELSLELKKSLLTDVPETKVEDSDWKTQSSNYINSRLKLLVSLLVVCVISAGIYRLAFYQPGVWLGYENESRYLSLVEQSVQNDALDPVLMELSMEELVPLMQTYALQEVTDAQRWVFLGRFYLNLGAFDMAKSALSRAYGVGGDIASGRLYLESLVRLKNNQLTPEIDRLIHELVQLAPNDPQLLLTKAALYFRMERYAEATDIWTELLNRPQTNDVSLNASAAEGRQVIQNYLEKAQRLMQQLKTAPLNEKPILDIGKNEGQVATSQAGVEKTLHKILTLNLQFEPTQEWPDSGFLWVVAKAKTGPPAPLAVRKIPIKEVVAQLNSKDQTLMVALSKSNAMMPELTINTFDDLEIKVRFTKTAEVVIGDQNWQAKQTLLAWKNQGGPVSVRVGLFR